MEYGNVKVCDALLRRCDSFMSCSVHVFEVSNKTEWNDLRGIHWHSLKPYANSVCCACTNAKWNELCMWCAGLWKVWIRSVAHVSLLLCAGGSFWIAGTSKSCISQCGRWASPRMLGKENPFCRECVCMHASQRLNEAMAFIDGDGNGETKMLCEFVASRSQRVHSLRGYFQIYR